MSMSWWQLLLLVFVMLQMSMLCTTIFLHRVLAHRAMSLHPAVSAAMHLYLGLLTGISPLHWLAVHLKHHAFSDKEGDPHSPNVQGFWRILFGSFLYYQREARNPVTLRVYGAGYRPDFVDRHSWIRHYGAVGTTLCVLVFGWKGLVVWVLHFVLYIVLNSMLNSLAHSMGERPNKKSQATNLWWLAILTAGEGWHNNHHTAPGAARFGSPDPAWPVIRTLATFGLAEVRNSRQT